MVGVLSSPDLYAITGGTPPTPGELAARYEHQVRGRSDDGTEEWHNWVVRVRAGGTAVGFVQATVTAVEGGRRAEVAWVVGTPWQGRGYASEATRAVVACLTGEASPADETRSTGDGPVVEVVAHIAPGHLASEGVAAHLGLRPTDVVHDGETLWSSRGAP